MKVLVACEESQAVCIAFRVRGHEAYSCDILPCSGGRPEWHIQADVLKHLDAGWDLIIAHPPCTFLSVAGAVRLFDKNHNINQERYTKGLAAVEFFNRIWKAPCDKICIENPRQLRIFGDMLPKFSQEIQPYMFGDPFRKATRLWVKGLPLLTPTKICEGEITNWVCAGSKGRPAHAIKAKFRDPKMRAKTFPGIAAAMAEQWGGAI